MKKKLIQLFMWILLLTFGLFLAKISIESGQEPVEVRLLHKFDTLYVDGTGVYFVEVSDMQNKQATVRVDGLMYQRLKVGENFYMKKAFVYEGDWVTGVGMVIGFLLIIVCVIGILISLAECIDEY